MEEMKRMVDEWRREDLKRTSTSTELIEDNKTPLPAMSENNHRRSIGCSADFFLSVNFEEMKRIVDEWRDDLKRTSTSTELIEDNKTPLPAMSENNHRRSIECSADYFGSVNFGSDLYGLCAPYMNELWFEDRKIVQDDTHEHELVNRFLKQVRQSKGYDVDCVPPLWLASPFSPVNLEWAMEYDSGHYYNYNLLGSANFAVAKINELTGQNYELVKIVKAVDTCTTLIYLTITARAHGAKSPIETFQALVEVPYGRYNMITELVEWKRKDEEEERDCGASSST